MRRRSEATSNNETSLSINIDLPINSVVIFFKLIECETVLFIK